jgi:phage gp36-like protein
MSSSDSDNDSSDNSNEAKKLQKQLKEANHQLQAYKGGRYKKKVEREGHGAVNQE